MASSFRTFVILILLSQLSGCHSDVEKERDHLSTLLDIATQNSFLEISQRIRNEQSHQSTFWTSVEDTAYLNKLDTLIKFGLEPDSVLRLRMKALTTPMLIPERSGNIGEYDMHIFKLLKHNIDSLAFSNMAEVRFLFYQLCNQQISTYHQRRIPYCGWAQRVIFQKSRIIYAGNEVGFMIPDYFINNSESGKEIKVDLTIKHNLSEVSEKYKLANYSDFCVASFVPSKKGEYSISGEIKLIINEKEIKTEGIQDSFTAH